MPQITIRTSPEIYIPAGTSNRNPYYKEFINQVLSVAPDLTVANVESDTNSNYSVLLRFMGNTEVGFRLNCSGDILNIYSGYWNKEGIFTHINVQSMSMFVAGRRFKVSSYGVDGALVYVMPYSEQDSTSDGFIFGMLTSTGYASPHFFVGLQGRDYKYPQPPKVPYGYNVYLSIYMRGPNEDNAESMYLTSFTDLSFVRTGYTHALQPSLYYITTNTKALFNIKWGGKYTIYHLYDANGVVQTAAGEIVTINGVEMLSPGYVAVIE